MPARITLHCALLRHRLRYSLAVLSHTSRSVARRFLVLHQSKVILGKVEYV
jgi:hypothetical protein